MISIPKLTVAVQVGQGKQTFPASILITQAKSYIDKVTDMDIINFINLNF
jgi:hypothetical protein